MLRLIRYFRAKPTRIIHATILLGVVVFLAINAKNFIFGMEMFAKIVNDPDHRMQLGDKHFNGLNSDAIRSIHEARDIKDSDFNIIFLGDSFIYGFLLNREQSPPSQLENILRKHYNRDDINVINFGWTSSSPYLDLRLLKEMGGKYKPDLVLLAVDMSDYRDEWFYKSILERRGVYQFIARFPRISFFIKKSLETLEPWINWHAKIFGYSGQGGYFVAKQPMEASLNLFDDIFDTLLQINDYSTNTLHAPLIVFMPPRHWQYTDNESPDSWENGSFDALGPYALENYRYFAMRQKETPYPLFTLLDEFRSTTQRPLTFRVDSHWNKHGAKFFAENVSKKIYPILDKSLLNQQE